MIYRILNHLLNLNRISDFYFHFKTGVSLCNFLFQDYLFDNID